MNVLNQLMNHTAEMSFSPYLVKRHISCRAVSWIGCLPLEILAVLENTFKLPFQTMQMTVKIPSKMINLCINSKSLREFDESLPGPLALLKTAFKIAGFIIGACFTATLGIITPFYNFRLHVAINLVRDLKAEAMELKKREEAEKLRQEQEAVMAAYFRELITAQRLKIAEKELDIGKEIKFASQDGLRQEGEQQDRQIGNESEAITIKQAIENAIDKRIDEENKEEGIKKNIAAMAAKLQEVSSSQASDQESAAKRKTSRWFF